MKILTLPCQIMDLLSDCLAVLDRNGLIVYANHAFQGLNKPFHDKQKRALYHELKKLNQRFQKSQKRYSQERIIVTPIGKEFVVFIYSLNQFDQKKGSNLVLLKAGDHERESEFLMADELMKTYYNLQEAFFEKLAPEFRKLKGKDLHFKKALLSAQKAARTDLPILIIGESGTGKEVLARNIHQISHRRKMSFVDINCSAIPENLIESELFGYEKGAFTGARKEGKSGLFKEAHLGTIFLDEVGDTSLPAQSKLLRVLQEGRFKRVGGTKNVHVDVRIISATNKELESMIREKRFRDDLFYRLNTITITLPPLRERKADIQLLAKLFLQEHVSRSGENFYFSEEALRLMELYNWPGNIRELKGVVGYAAIMSESREIGVESLPPSLFLERSFSQKEKNSFEHFYSDTINSSLLPHIIQNVEKEMIEMAIKKSRTRSQAINILGISRRTFYKKIKQYNLEIDLKR
jgi:transcriptional regulator with PAS, ATPase and Fis domain